MEVITALIESGLFNTINVLLIGVIGILLYFVFIKQKNSENQINNTVEGMKILLEEEREHTQILSKTVYEIRGEMEKEREKNYALRDEILVLKNENIRLQNLVTQMEQLVKQYQEEIETLKNERNKE